MASLFSETGGDLRVLDPGAGVGSLTAAVAERLCAVAMAPRSVEFVCYEVDEILLGYLRDTLDQVEARCRGVGIEANGRFVEKDFVLCNGVVRRAGLTAQDDAGFSHAILNPPYRKITAGSEHRRALREAGIETSNLYTGFMFLAARHLRAGGEMVAIVPRSFCNGPYFRAFRERFFSMMYLRYIHLFERRNRAFRHDDVLQENVILHAVKADAAQADVTITTSSGAAFEVDPAGGACNTEGLTRRTVAHDAVVRTDGADRFVHIAANGIEQGIVDRMAYFGAALSDIGVEVSTGPVVDFRLREDLRAQPEDGAVPLLYAAHFHCGEVSWPKAMRKPNAIRVSERSRQWLWINSGYYVVTRRFTSKEEPRRIVAAVYSSNLPGDHVGFENHLNVFHSGREGMGRNLARGLALFLNSSLVDRYFRQFNGHTQVNATDLRSLRYPDRASLERLGLEHGERTLSQGDIDGIIEDEVAEVAVEENPLDAQRKIDSAVEILKALGMPRGQQNDRSALTLLALLDLEPSGKWEEIERPVMGITRIMDYIREHYKREYAADTRGAFGRETMRQFVEAGIAQCGADEAAGVVNSPNACYHAGEEVVRVIATFGTRAWQAALKGWVEARKAVPGEEARRAR